MKLYSLLVVLFFALPLSAMPSPSFQDVGTVNFSACSTGNVGTTVGVFEQKGVCGEIGMSYNIIERRAMALDAKIGIKEGVYSVYSPSFAVGVFNGQIRQKHEVLSSNNVLFALTSKSYKDGRLHIGVFHGNRMMGKDRKGCFVGYTHHILYEVTETSKTRKLDAYLEYVGGKSSLGGALAEIKYFITPKLSIKAGPSWNFNKETLETSKWSFEKCTWILGISFDM